ncbi:hypothetical protein Pan241w_26280 [Gimesia alba]|uniref:Uncharacterized protein n=1 Tax=Gimesia alba TaxID=2527973 RepID=A0A517RF90_9PLAN|nr:hypothetical protein [Gimesia alba]QDT42543.1 hypothetical protein Pan241w_26280 [Gimesia alba]
MRPYVLILLLLISLFAPISTSAGELTEFQKWYMIQNMSKDMMRLGEHLKRQEMEKINRQRPQNPDLIPQTFLCNYRKDFNNDGICGITEYVGLNKSRYISSNPFMIGMYLPVKGIIGKSYEIKVYSPQGNIVYKYSGFFKEEWKAFDWKWDLNAVVKKYGAGTYSFVFYYNGGHWDTKKATFLLGDSSP